jgi:hypothetical protein
MSRKAMNSEVYSEAEEEWSYKQKAANHIINVIIIGWNNHNCNHILWWWLLLHTLG